MSLPNFSRLSLHDDEATTESRLSDLTLNQQDTAGKKSEQQGPGLQGLVRSSLERVKERRAAELSKQAKKAREQREDEYKKILMEVAAERQTREELEKLDEFRVYAKALLPHWENLARWTKRTGTGPWYNIRAVVTKLDPAWMYLLLGLKSSEDVWKEGMEADQSPTWQELTRSLEAAEAALSSEGGIPMPSPMKGFYRMMKQRIQEKYVPMDTEGERNINLEELRHMITEDPTWGEWLRYQYLWFNAARERATRAEEERVRQKYAGRAIRDMYALEELGNG